MFSIVKNKSIGSIFFISEYDKNLVVIEWKNLDLMLREGGLVFVPELYLKIIILESFNKPITHSLGFVINTGDKILKKGSSIYAISSKISIPLFYFIFYLKTKWNKPEVIEDSNSGKLTENENHFLISSVSKIIIPKSIISLYYLHDKPNLLKDSKSSFQNYIKKKFNFVLIPKYIFGLNNNNGVDINDLLFYDNYDLNACCYVELLHLSSFIKLKKINTLNLSISFGKHGWYLYKK